MFKVLFLFADAVTWIWAFILDGKTLVTAAAQLKTFDCSNHKKIQKFTGHPVSVFSVYIPFGITALSN